ncbi:MAG: FG-GAP repeat domain-containing protein [Salinibacter sp.]
MAWPMTSNGYWRGGALFGAALVLFAGCSLFSEERSLTPDDCFANSPSAAQGSIAGVSLIHWHPDRNIPRVACGYGEGRIDTRLNLTRLHGEREFTRNARLVDLTGDGRRELLTRTMNENRVRALNPQTGETLWMSPSVLPAFQHPQASDLAVGDITGDGNLEVLIVTYDGHVLCINGQDGTLRWRRELPYHINNPNLQGALGNITAGEGLELALTVGTEVEPGPRNRPRINLIHNPSLLVLQSNGETAWIAEQYDESNSRGHNTWAHDVDRDGLAEVFAIGADKLIAFGAGGSRQFSLPMQHGGHPDKVLFSGWAPDHPGDEIIYTDGIRGIGVASSQGEILQHREITDGLGGHLQDLFLIQSPEGPRLFAQHIRDGNAKSVLYDETLTPQWAAQLGYDASMQHTTLIDWTGDGDPEIATGSISETGDQQCSVQVMELDGTPLYWHRWGGSPLCVITDATKNKLVLGVGRNEGSQGRYSLPAGQSINLVFLSALSE